MEANITHVGVMPQQLGTKRRYSGPHTPRRGHAHAHERDGSSSRYSVNDEIANERKDVEAAPVCPPSTRAQQAHSDSDDSASTTAVAMSSASSQDQDHDQKQEVQVQVQAQAHSPVRNEAYFQTLYTTPPSFQRLGQQNPSLAALLNGTHLDFTHPSALPRLTSALLSSDFGISITLSANRLCPPVPNRHNYILWLKALLDSSGASYADTYEAERRVDGLDIGTGASLIYPLLGCAQRQNWRFVATDTDALSLEGARANQGLNKWLGGRIRIEDRGRGASGEVGVGVGVETPLIPLDELGIEKLDFAMTNPPFYTSEAELLGLAAQKKEAPPTACTGAPVEMVCEGGEVGFVGRMIGESLALKGRVQWYTAMLGKQSSLEALIDILKKHKINNYAVTTFIQGSRTRRWGLAWSFLSRRPSVEACRGVSSIAKTLLPPVTEVTIYEGAMQNQDPSDPVLRLTKMLHDTLTSLDLRQWTWDEHRLRGVGFSQGNVWSRAYRRKKAREVNSAAIAEQEASASASLPDTDISACSFGFSLSILAETPDTPHSRPVLLRWLQGDDESLFEAFAGVIRRCLRKDDLKSS